MTSHIIRRIAPAAALLAVLGTAACSSSSSSGGNSSSAAAASPTSTVPTEAVIGMSVEQATTWAGEHGFTVRVIMQDGQPLPATKDYREDRINLTVDKGVVTQATMG